MKWELERSGLQERWGCAMWKGEHGMDVASSVEEDDGNEEVKGKGKTRRCLQSQRQNTPRPRAALVAPESTQLLHRQLRKRYYAQVLNFMRMVAGAKWVFFSSFLFSSLLSHCFPSERKVADMFHLLIILAYFL